MFLHFGLNKNNLRGPDLGVHYSLHSAAAGIQIGIISLRRSESILRSLGRETHQAMDLCTELFSGKI
jgi:hypothetical protein